MPLHTCQRKADGWKMSLAKNEKKENTDMEKIPNVGKRPRTD
jgi:hypothetical protein